MDAKIGMNYVIALDANGDVWSWGFNMVRRLEYKPETYLLPRKISSLSDIVQIDVVNSHNIALKFDGTVWILGYASYMKALMAFYSHVEPIKLDGTSGVKKLAAGSNHCVEYHTSQKVPLSIPIWRKINILNKINMLYFLNKR